MQVYVVYVQVVVVSEVPWKLDIEFGRKQTHNQTFPVSVDFFRYDKARLTLTLRPVLLSYSSPDVL
jgi:hypothetical protein